VGLGRTAGAGDDLVGLATRVREPLAVLAQQLVGLDLGALRVVDRVLDRLLALVERLTDTRERDLPQDEQRECKDHEGPEHEPDDRIDETRRVDLLGGEQVGHARNNAIRPETRP
jgi:hypothetical protein